MASIFQEREYFVSYWIHPLIKTDNGDITKVEPELAQFWGLYGRTNGGLEYHIKDAPDKETLTLLKRMLTHQNNAAKTLIVDTVTIDTAPWHEVANGDDVYEFINAIYKALEE